MPNLIGQDIVSKPIEFYNTIHITSGMTDSMASIMIYLRIHNDFQSK
jgi:hypothetical protein